MNATRRFVVSIVLMAACPGLAAGAAEQQATVREYRTVIRTYPFSDPNPVAVVGRIYPYFRYEGYTDTPVDWEWTVVELENAYLRVRVLPEIGGKIWSAVEKSTGRSFIYDNHVVKFRDIAMRGPWTSGGIEPNYGIIGHTPNCATPVDYLTRSGEDGSASVVVGVLDLLTRTRWRLEITLPADAAYFTTKSFWHNGTPIEQPYYTWMNAGIKAAGNLELIYPGTHYIGHGGDAHPWPIDAANGKNLAFYEQNDFGPYKSYHVLGRHTGFFGAYWHDDGFGMGHYSTREDKLGKKAWIWGLSRQGMIWERLLTDHDGQYVEVQSGRLFNQAADDSVLTPFKHRGFAPRSSDTWTEYWFPVKGTGGFVAANEHGALNVVARAAEASSPARLEIRFSPLMQIDDRLVVFDGDRPVASFPLRLAPMVTWSESVAAAIPQDRLRVKIGSWLDYRPAGDELSRPLATAKDFDWESVQGLHLKARAWIRQREYARAREALDACLRKDPHFLPALADAALVRYREMDDAGAWDAARRGLAVDAYDGAANYYYGLASVRLGKAADASDGFEVASLSPEFRGAAMTELARLHLVRGAFGAALDYARRSLAGNGENVECLQVAALVERLGGRGGEARATLDAISALDPLNPFVGFERHMLAGDERSARAFAGSIRNELPHESFLELAAWYRGVGRFDEARRVLELAPRQTEVLYWLAFLQAKLSLPAAGETLRQAEAASPRLVFPFRPESVEVFEWAAGQRPGWRSKYYLALIAWGRNQSDRARDLLTQCGETPDFAPFYAARARAIEPVSRDRALADLLRAAELDPREWRFGMHLAERYLEDGLPAKALEVATRYFEASPGSYILGMLRARCLLRAGRFQDAADALSAVKVLPYEGATAGRSLHREAQLMLGAQAWRAGDAAEAIRRVTAAREWPENLGAGKPYPEDLDERLEDRLEAFCRRRIDGPADPSQFLGRPATLDEQRILSAWLPRSR